MVFCNRSPGEAKVENHKTVKFKEIMFTKQGSETTVFTYIYIFFGGVRVRVLNLYFKRQPRD